MITGFVNKYPEGGKNDFPSMATLIVPQAKTRMLSAYEHHSDGRTDIQSDIVGVSCAANEFSSFH